MHHLGYHEIYGGPELPKDEAGIFKAVVLSATGVIPRQGLDVTSKEYKIVDLTKEQHKKIGRKTQVARSKPLSMFFADFVSRQGNNDMIEELKIEEFLDKRTPDTRKFEIARILLSACVDVSIDNLGLDKIHTELKQDGFYIKPKPDGPRSVAKHYIRQNYMDFFIDRLDNRLATS